MRSRWDQGGSWRSLEARSGTQGGFLMIFDGFGGPYGIPILVFSDVFGVIFLCVFLSGSQDRFFIDFGWFWDDFWEAFGALFVICRFHENRALA